MQSLRRISARLPVIVSSPAKCVSLCWSSGGRHREVGVRGRIPCDAGQREQRSVGRAAGAKHPARMTEKPNQALGTPSRIDSTGKLVEMLARDTRARDLSVGEVRIRSFDVTRHQ